MQPPLSPSPFAGQSPPTQVPASFVKQHFGQALALAAQRPLTIEKHSRPVAVLVSAADWQRVNDSAAASADEANSESLAARRAARAAQQQLERDRLMHHQRVGIALLTANPAERDAQMQAARATVARWAQRRSCSADFVAQWMQWLSLPAARLVQAMCDESSASGARAMRQNSPFWYAPFVQVAEKAAAAA